ncbi:hypothetical protein ACHAWF_004138 [Thalassiosira exigua]
MTGVLWALKRLAKCAGEEEAPSLAGYLPSLSNLPAEFPRFVAETCPRATPPGNFAFVDNPGLHGSQKDEHGFYRAAKEVWKGGGRAARALCAIHALDYACYDAIPVPPLCRSVFVGPSFRDRIFRAIPDVDPAGRYRCWFPEKT